MGWRSLRWVEVRVLWNCLVRRYARFGNNDARGKARSLESAVEVKATWSSAACCALRLRAQQSREWNRWIGFTRRTRLKEEWKRKRTPAPAAIWLRRDGSAREGAGGSM